MVRFVADMGVSLQVVEWLRECGYDVWHLRERGLQRLPDRQIFELAKDEGRCVITFDLGFSEIAALSENPGSVILLRLTNQRAQSVISRLERVLAEVSRALEEGAIVTVEDNRFRVRRIPL